MMAALMTNQYTWSQDPSIGKWLVQSRLDALTKLIAKVAPDDTEKLAIIARMRGNAMPAMANLQKFIAQMA